MSLIGYWALYSEEGNDYVKNANGTILGIRYTDADNVDYLVIAGKFFNNFDVGNLKIEFPMIHMNRPQGKSVWYKDNVVGELSHNIYRYDLPNPTDPLFSTVEHEPFDEEGNLKPNLLSEPRFFHKHVFMGSLGFGIPFKQLFLNLVADKESLTDIQPDTYE